MSQPNPSTALAMVVIDELVRGGVSLFVISPGSRSAALAIAISEHEGVDSLVMLDERSAAFYALGRAKASRTAVGVVSTSGTAAANYFPAVIEADMSCTPLVVLTADRPAELQGVGANQTIDQMHLFGRHVRSFESFEAPGADVDKNEEWREITARAAATARGLDAKPGPVHLNVRFREPTVPVSDDGRSSSRPYEFDLSGRPGGRPWIVSGDEPGDTSTKTIDARSRGVVIAGDGEYDRRGLVEAADAMGWPLLATALSGLRAHQVVTTYHHLANDLSPSLQPETVVAIGSVGPSRRLEELVDSARTVIRVDRWGRHIDPGRNATEVVATDPVTLLREVSGRVEGEVWRKTWLDADSRARSAIDAELSRFSGASGPGVARALNDVGWGSLVVGSSLPIRDVDAHLSRGGAVIGNRGASGIDGLVSTALGVSSVGSRTLALTGDLSFFHDSGGLMAAAGHDLLIVVVDNGGGGLFDLLPPARHAPDYERLFIAAQTARIDLLAESHHVSFHEVSNLNELVEECRRRLDSGGAHLLRVLVDREEDLTVRDALDDAVFRAVSSLQP